MEIQVPSARENFYAPFISATILVTFITFTIVVCVSLFILPLISPAICQQTLYGAAGPLFIAACVVIGIVSIISAARQFDWFWILLFAVCLGSASALISIRLISPIFLNICEIPQDSPSRAVQQPGRFHRF
jgi:hypothetical protein